MNEMVSLKLNGTKYDSFVDKTARESVGKIASDIPEAIARAKVTSHLLGDGDTLDALVENGLYYLADGTDNLLIRQILRDAGVPVPEEMKAEGIFARAMFVDVTQVEGVIAGTDDPVGQPCQQLTVYFDQEKGDGTWAYEFHRVHDFTGSHPDGSAWGNWITATRNHLEVEPEIVTFRYGEATLEQIRQAKLAGKIVFATDGSSFLLLQKVAEVRAVFGGFSDGTNHEFVVTGDIWTEAYTKYPDQEALSRIENNVRHIMTADYGAAGSLDGFTEPGVYIMEVDSEMVEDYPELFVSPDGTSAERAEMTVGRMKDAVGTYLYQSMTVYFPVTVDGVGTYKSMPAHRLLHGDPPGRRWRIARGDLKAEPDEAAALEDLA